MGRHRFRKLALVGAVGAVIAACGGGSTDLAEGGIGGTGISTGTVTGFGSVWVNGVEFETDQATIHKEGMKYMGSGMDQKYLRIGMVVTVKGDIDANGMRGTATTVEYSSLLRGPVDVAYGAGKLVIMGQEVRVDDGTTYQGVSNPAELSAGVLTEVSGFYVHDSNGGYIQATYIEKLTGSITEYKVSGVVDSIDSGEFEVGGLDVYWSNASQLAVGDYVEVQLRADMYERDEYWAVEVDQKAAGLGVTEAKKAEMEGIVLGTCASLPCGFKLGLQDIQVDSNTTFSNGRGYTDIQSGVRLEVEGSVTGGVLIAREVDFED